MTKNMHIHLDKVSSENKLAELQAQLAAEQQRCQDLKQELVRLKSREPIQGSTAARDLRSAEALSAHARTPHDIHAAIESIYQSAPVGLCVLDTQLRYMQVNACLAEMNGLPAEAHIGRTIKQVVPVLADQAEAKMRQAILSGEPVIGLEISCEPEAAPGGTCTWLLNGEPLKSADGGVIGLNVATFGITKQKQAEAALRDSEARVRIMADGLPLIIWVHDSEGRQQFVNKTFIEFFGITAEEARDFRWQQLIHPEDAEEHVDAFMACVHTHRPFHAQVRVRRGDGAWRWIESFANPRHSSAGAYLGHIGTSVDITERKQAEESLIESETRYRNLFRYSPDAIFINQSDRFTFVNDAALRLFGAQSAEELMGKTPYDLFHPEFHPLIKEHIRQLRARGEAVSQIEEKIVRLDGRIVDVEVTAAPFPFGGSKAIHVILRDITDRKRAQAALRASQELLERSQQIAHLGSWELDLVNHRLTWSDEVYRIFGLQHQKFDATYEAFIERVHPEDRAAVDAAYTESLRDDRQSYEIEHRVIRKSTGEIRFVHEKCKHFRDPAGRIFRSVGIVHDITERKRFEKALRDSEAYMHSIFRVAPTGFGVVSERIFKEVNDKFCKMTGYSKEELVGQSSRIIYATEEEYERVGRVKYAQISKAGTGTVETVLKHKNGTRINVLMSSTPINHENLREGVTFTALDITHRKRSEEALRKSEHRYRTLFNSMEAFCLLEPILDADGRACDFRYLEVNAAGARLRNSTPDVIVGRTILEMFPKIDNFWIQSYEQVLATGQAIQFERHFKESDRWYRTYAYCPEKGKIASLILDITDRKKTEQALQDLTKTLEQRVLERTELAEARAKQLQHLAIELIEAEESERHQIAQLLHDDLQQVLAAARMQLQTAIYSSHGESRFEKVDQLLEESIRTSRRLSHELSPPVLHHSGLVAALKWLSRQVRSQFGLKVELKINAEPLLDSTPLKVFIFRAVKELLFNITKHADVKSARVVLSCAGKNLIIIVSDQGKGFDANVLAPTAAVHGLGLLSIRERARHIGGDLMIKSVLGKGSRFTLKVPFSMSQSHAAPATPTGHRISAAPPTLASKETDIRVLLADDHKIIRQGLIQLIARQPDIHVVSEAANGHEALELTRQLRPDVVLMDISMPKMDGIEATRRIKREMPEVRVIGLSMHDDPQTAQTMYQAGAEAFVSKTASSSELLKAIYRIHYERKASLLYSPAEGQTAHMPTQLTFSWPL